MAYNVNVADVSFNTNGDNTVIAGVTGRRLRVLAIVLQNTNSTTNANLVFKDGTTAINATAYQLSSGGGGFTYGTVDSHNAGWVCESATQGNAFVINSDSTDVITGRIWYQAI